jgi:hypothetical protein
MQNRILTFPNVYHPAAGRPRPRSQTVRGGRGLLPPLALGLMFLLPPAAGAQIRHDWRESPVWDSALDGSLVDVQVLVDGEASPLYLSPRGTDERRYFQAFEGRNYSIVLHNNTPRRIGVLVAVDGLNVVNGEITRLTPGEGMYVLDPWERAEIRGWRTSLDHVRRFVFVDESRSYAERTDQANNDMGWIRVLSFRERRPWWGSYRDGREDRRTPRLDGERKSSPEAGSPQAGEMQRSKPSEKPQGRDESGNDNRAYGDDGSFPGTGWGDRKYDPVRETRFTADGGPVDHLVLRYEYESGLLALGIEPRHLRSRDRLRERDGEFGFAQPPRR